MRLPRRTVRLRLTLLYGGLFLLSGAALLTITYLLVKHTTGDLFFVRDTVTRPKHPKVGTSLSQLPASVPASMRQLARQGQADAHRQHAHELHQLLVESGIALAIMAVVSIALGWLVAGRVLSPLRTMTHRTRRISEHNLHERLALGGPSDELKDLADTIDGLLARLESAFEAQQRFVANASHELRTPLAMMRTSLDVATGKRGRVPPELNALGDKFREGLDQADRLLESFLTLARAQRGTLSVQSAVALSDIVAAAIERRHDAIAAKGIEVEPELDAVAVLGSDTLIARMVENLIDNAIRHNVRSGWIRVQTQAHGERARLVVESGGRVLDQAAVQELAQPFRRLGAERVGSENGVGLGLSIVAAIATAHCGRLELRARLEGGLRALVELPAAVPVAPVGARA